MKRFRQGGCFLPTVALSFSAFLPIMASAQKFDDRHWVTSGTGDWFETANWDPAGVPMGNTSIGNGGTAVIASGTPFTESLTVGDSGTGGLVINGGALSVLNANIGNQGEGTVVVNSGSWSIAENLRLGFSSLDAPAGTGNLVINGGTVTDLEATLGNGDSDPSQGNVTVSGGTWNTMDTLTIGGTAACSLLINGGQVISFAASIEFGANVTVSSGAWNNSGTLQVAPGSLTVSGGMLSAGTIVSGPSPLGTIVSGILVSGGGVIETGQFLLGNVDPRASNLLGIKIDQGTLRAAASQNDFLSNSFDNLVNFASGGAKIDSNGFDIGIAAVLTGDGGLNKLGEGTLSLTGSNSYAGGTTINAGTLGIGSNNAIGAGTLVINGGGIRAEHSERTVFNLLALNGSFTLGRLTNFSGNAVLGADITITSANPDVQAPTSTSGFSGVISGTHGITFAVGANPTGTLILSGSNTYTGDTVISGGQVAVDGSIAGRAIVQDTGFLKGSGTIGGAAIVMSGGTLSPGDGVGRITLLSDLTMDGGSTLVMEFSGASAGLFDQIDVQGIFSAGGTLSLMLVDGYTPLEGASFTIFNGSTPGFDSGSFNISTNLTGGLYWDTTALGSTGVVTVVPEPSTWALLGAGFVVLIAARARRTEFRE